MLLTAILLAVGIYMLIVYREMPQLTKEQLANYRIKRNIGIFLIITSVIFGIYFWSTGQKFRATMNSDCATCKLYVQRHRGLRPYRPEEYRLLQQHAASCNSCSQMCSDYVDLLSNNPTTKPGELKKANADCADTTKHAILARNELKRVEGKLRGKEVSYWRAAREGGETYWDPFPQVPK